LTSPYFLSSNQSNNHLRNLCRPDSSASASANLNPFDVNHVTAKFKRTTTTTSSGDFLLIKQLLSNTGVDRTTSEYFNKNPNTQESSSKMKFFSQLLVLGLAAEATVASNWFSKSGMSAIFIDFFSPSMALRQCI
jgi:hypothetical protein